ncbi:hypothetical protein LOTGIDRAFT_159583 [Lottia gigantea]|uniref:Lysine-specific demethylase 3B PWWP domain-containing protein n=1 Tax=Lottia gigantea TaxID=225164 RepID=V4C5H8_LOTGI|nr:hypothetical protein LOTGIDRAFT_159583 [Lottia gigantea]ESO96839.1 hypothetical protein LOTGIDRAFT_159583 [Lottia gigantea]
MIIPDTEILFICPKHEQVLVEFDDCDWHKREWVKVHEVFQIFWVEHTLVWAYRADPNKNQSEVLWPGLSFKPLVDKASLGNSKRKPVEFFLDRYLGLVEEKDFSIYQFDVKAYGHGYWWFGQKFELSKDLKELIVIKGSVLYQAPVGHTVLLDIVLMYMLKKTFIKKFML